MPEVLTKYPQVTLQVLRSAGAQCGEGARQAILAQCPARNFCKLPGGEMCVYAPTEAGQMTQFSAADWQAVQLALSPAEASVGGWLDVGTVFIGGAGVLVGVILGFAAGRVMHARR